MQKKYLLTQSCNRCFGCMDGNCTAHAQIIQKETETRKKEAEDRLNGQKEEEVDPKLAAKGKKPDPKAAAPAKGGAKGKVEAVPDGQLIQVSQYAITPAIGSIAPGSAAVISVTFNAQGSKFYNTTLSVDVANRDPND